MARVNLLTKNVELEKTIADLKEEIADLKEEIELHERPRGWRRYYGLQTKRWFNDNEGLVEKDEPA
jgi:hypothetical protein